MLGWVRRIQVPHVLALLMLIVLAAAVLTYVIPSGRYERRTTLVGGTERTLLVPGTYKRIPKSFELRDLLLTAPEDTAQTAKPTSVQGFLTAIPRGLAKSQDIVFFIFIIGGALGIVQRTGAITAAIRKLLSHLGHSAGLMTTVIMLVIAVGGSTLGMGEEFIPLVPLFLMLSRRLGYDRVYAVALVFVAAEVGFASATTNPFTIQVAQSIAELRPTSGMTLRLVFFGCTITLTIMHVLRYGARIQVRPELALAPFDDDAGDGDDGFDDHVFSRTHLAILASCGVVFAGILVAVQTLNWWMEDMAGGFLLMGIVAAVIGRLSVNQAAGAFVKGMEDMVVAAIVVGFARAIQVVLDDARITDTVIHSAAGVLQSAPRYASAEGMLLFQTTLNFLIPSGSGQAVVTMPLMAPLADLLNISRQTSVFAFQCGDGLSNIVIPTSGILMAMLSLADVPYQKWLRFVVPLFLQLLVLGGVFLAVAVAIGYQ